MTEIVDWAEFEASDGDLADHARRRLTQGVCSLATVRPDGFPAGAPGRRPRPGRPARRADEADVAQRGRHQRDGRFARCTTRSRTGREAEARSSTGVASETEAPDDFARRGWIARLGTAEVLSVVYPGREDRPLVSRWSR